MGHSETKIFYDVNLHQTFSATCIINVTFSVLSILSYVYLDTMDCKCFRGLFTQLPMRRMRICFTDVFFCFLPFPFATKIPDNRSWERLNGYSGNFYQTIAGKMEFASPYLNGARPLINFWGLKTTHCALGGDAWRVTEN